MSPENARQVLRFEAGLKFVQVTEMIGNGGCLRDAHGVRLPVRDNSVFAVKQIARKSHQF